ncbi:MAG: hypothetical protein K0A90_00265 [Methanosarcinaceae archaeon]|nr:hypothetical protein [Methanosarcinaceae archaeon]
MKTIIKKTETINMKISRCPIGLEIYIKSPVIEDFFKGLAQGVVSTSTESNWLPHKGYTPQGNIEHIANTHFDNWGGSLVQKGYYNLSMLRTVGLSKGQTFRFKGVFSKNMIENIATEFKTVLITLIKNYVKPMEVTIKVYSNEII